MYTCMHRSEVHVYLYKSHAYMSSSHDCTMQAEMLGKVSSVEATIEKIKDLEANVEVS